MQFSLWSTEGKVQTGSYALIVFLFVVLMFKVSAASMRNAEAFATSDFTHGYLYEFAVY